MEAKKGMETGMETGMEVKKGMETGMETGMEVKKGMETGMEPGTENFRSETEDGLSYCCIKCIS